jgi:hypothetical protein
MEIEKAIDVRYLINEYQKYNEAFKNFEQHQTTGDRNVGSLTFYLHSYFDKEADKYHKYLYDAIKEMFTSKISEITTELDKY